MSADPNRSKSLLLSATLFMLVCGGFGCSLAKRAVDDGSNPPVNGRRMNDKMSDGQILEIFGIDPASATSTVARGPDGFSTHYAAGTQKIGITRSVVTGVVVWADGPIKGNWDLTPD